MTVTYVVRGHVNDQELTHLHTLAFGEVSNGETPWSDRLAKHSLLWVTAHDGPRLVGFVNVIGDGGKHAVLLDTIVDPDRQGEGIGRRMVEMAAEGSREAGCVWLHVDYEEDLTDFYEQRCGFRRTAAGLLSLV